MWNCNFSFSQTSAFYFLNVSTRFPLLTTSQFLLPFLDGYIILGLTDGLVHSVARFYKVALQCTSKSIQTQSRLSSLLVVPVVFSPLLSLSFFPLPVFLVLLSFSLLLYILLYCICYQISASNLTLSISFCGHQLLHTANFITRLQQNISP